ncbi:MAG: hypothetical protein AB7O98_00245 [Hyphomonadaceae bacterium]
MSSFWQSVRTAYSGWWTLLGLLAASVSGFNLLRKLLDIGLAEALQLIVHAYQSVVYPPILALVRLMDIAPPPEWLMDIGVFWLLIAGVVLRSAWAIRAATIRDGVRMGGTSKFWSSLMQERLTLPIFLLLALIAWPYMVWMLLSAPHVIRYKRSRSFAPRTQLGETLPRGSEYYCDMRVVLGTHALTAIACVAAWGALNVLLH